MSPPPLAGPVLVVGKEEDVGGQFAAGVAVGRDGAALPGVIPFHGEDYLR